MKTQYIGLNKERFSDITGRNSWPGKDASKKKE
jgi:hypothetical protein